MTQLHIDSDENNDDIHEYIAQANGRNDELEADRTLHLLNSL